MIQGPMRAERRNAKRHRVREGIFAHVVSGVDTVGKVLDVSEGGLAIEYLADKTDGQDDGMLLRLFGRSGKSYLADVPLKKISDHAVPRASDFSTLVVRRMGIAFQKMKPDQKEQLYHFIVENSLN